MWEGASIWTLHHETQGAAAMVDLLELSISTQGPLGPTRVTFKFLVMSFTKNLFFPPYCSAQADGQLWDLAFPDHCPDTTESLTSQLGFYSDVHSEL